MKIVILDGVHNKQGMTVKLIAKFVKGLRASNLMCKL